MPTKTKKAPILSTTDYDLFTMRKDNREINWSHVASLKKSFEKYDDFYLRPAIVNDEMHIIDGQHRFHAAQQLGNPIYYVIDNNFVPEKLVVYNREMRRLSTANYLNFFKEQKNEDYIKLYNFVEKTKLPLHICLIYLNNRSGTGYHTIREGAYNFSPPANIKQTIKYVQKFIKWLRDRDIRPKTILHQRALHCALRIFLTSEDVLLEDFFHRLETTSKNIRYTNSSDDYIKQLVDIYNYRLHKHNQLKIEKSNFNTKISGV